MTHHAADPREVAFYYPGHLWRHPEWIKTLLLFFDGIGLLVPEYKQEEPERLDPILAGPLKDRGLLHYLIADSTVDADATKHLARAMTDLLTSGALDNLAADGTAFHEISMSRMGYYGDRSLAEAMFKQFRARGLARESQDGVSVPLHPMIRYLYLVLLSQILRSRGPSLGLELSPATDQPQVVRALTELLQLPNAASAGHVVALDMKAVSVDLSAIPLDEVLDFRNQHEGSHRKYARSVRMFARELSLIPEGERERALNDRQAELEDLATDLRQVASKAWKRPATFALGLAGAAWTYKTGDPMGALLGIALQVMGESEVAAPEAGAFSYLFAAGARYS